MKNAQMNDSLVKTLDPQLARTLPKKIANHKSTALETQLPLAQLIEKIYQEDNTRIHMDRHETSTNSTLSSIINNISLDIDNLTVRVARTMKHDIAYGNNVVRHKYSNDPNFKGKTLFFKFCKRCSQSGHSNYNCPVKRYAKTLEKPIFKNKLSSSIERELKTPEQTSHIK